MQYPVAEGMERGYPHGRISVRHETVHPLLHLVSGLFGEGKGEDLRGVHALFYEGRDASGDNARLTGACSGYDKKRSVAVLHGLDLSFVEPFAQAKRGIVIQIRRHLGAEVIFLMALLPESATYKSPFLATAMPVGKLKDALIARASENPGESKPATVLTAPEDAILRTLLLRESQT